MRHAVLIIGGGGHGLVVAESAAAAGFSLAGMLDDNPQAVLSSGAPAAAWLGSLRDLHHAGAIPWVLGLGDLARRRGVLERLRGGAVAVVHPRAALSPSGHVGEGAFVAAGAVIQARAGLGAHCIINTGAVIEHECVIGENAHIAPGAVLGGGVQVGADTLVGLGARILPNLRIGHHCIIGAGAVVTRDVPDHSTVKGVPARNSK